MSGTHPSWLLEDAAVPGSVDGLVQILSDGEGPYLPTSGKSSLCRGGVPTIPPRPLDLSGMNRIIEHAEKDLTVRVEAGTTLVELEATLAKHDQWFPPGSFSEEGGTVGGLIGTDWRTPLSPGFGSVRDYLIGVSFVDGRGRLARAGGQVVKNVAGYDLMKMLIGSLGELGVVAEAVFRLLPRAGCWSGVVVDHPDRDLRKRTLEEVGKWFPAGLWRGDIGEGERLWAVFHGSVSRVRFQVDSAQAFWGEGSRVMEEEETLALLSDMTRISRPRNGTGWGGALPTFLIDWNPDAATWVADLLGGHVWARPGGVEFWPRVAALRRDLRSGEGHLNVDVGETTEGEDIWGRIPEHELSLWRDLKRVLDPDRMLVEGRLPGGI